MAKKLKKKPKIKKFKGKRTDCTNGDSDIKMDKDINIKEAMNYINFKKNTPKDSNIYALINYNMLMQEKVDITDPNFTSFF